MKPRGHLVGIPISQTTDADSSFWAIMWSFGGKVLKADGKTIAIESAEMEATLDYDKRLYTEAMDPAPASKKPSTGG